MYFDQHGLEMIYINRDLFQPQAMKKLNDTPTKMYFNQPGLEKLNDASTRMYFNQQGLENLNDTSN